MAKEADFISVSLGKRILRTETAAIHLVGLKEYQYENL
ncbi:MAG: 16S rRNA (uracil(1498)-N(3))-methyltransferase [Bacilli bacterium]